MPGSINIVIAGADSMPIKEPLKKDGHGGYEHQPLHVTFRGFKVSKASYFDMSLEYVGGDAVFQHDFITGFIVRNELVNSNLRYHLSGNRLRQEHDYTGRVIKKHPNISYPKGYDPHDASVSINYFEGYQVSHWFDCDHDTVEIYAEQALPTSVYELLEALQVKETPATVEEVTTGVNALQVKDEASALDEPVVTSKKDLNKEEESFSYIAIKGGVWALF